MRGVGPRAAAAGVIALAVVGGCGLGRSKAPVPDPSTPRVSANELGPRDPDVVMDALTPDERDALARVDGEDDRPIETADDVTMPEPAAPKDFFGRLGDDIGKIGVAVVGVGLTIGMAVAPFFLF